MRIGFGISIQSAPYIDYEFDNRYWSRIEMKWETINDTWEEEI
tara:strand:- start:335 stop:463 length:129 start_codon:yes stop_codon:yes gene_type:complete